jgi:hypothetical protein
MHLSQENNRPDLAGQEMARPLAGSRVNVEVARRDRPLVVEVGQALAGVGQLPLFGADGRAAVG